MNRRRFIAILWKELLDLSRDRKTLAATILGPMLLLPLMGLAAVGMAKGQPPVLALCMEDNGSWAQVLREEVLQAARARGVSVVEEPYEQVLRDPYVDAILLVPEGFSRNASSLNATVKAVIELRAGSPKAFEAYGAASAALSRVSHRISVHRVEQLARVAGVNVTPDVILNPLRMSVGYVTPTGGRASPQEALLYYTVIALILALFLSIPAPTSFVADSVAGERERKTLEMLLASPASRSEVLLAKLAASSALGFAAAIASSVGAFAYIAMFSLGLAGAAAPPIGFDAVAFYAFVVFATVLSTASIVLLVSVASESVRSATAVSMLVISLAAIVFMAAMFGDPTRLPSPWNIIVLLIPYTYSVAAIRNYVYGRIPLALTYTAALFAVSAALIIAAYKLFHGERLLAKPRQ